MFMSRSESNSNVIPPYRFYHYIHVYELNYKSHHQTSLFVSSYYSSCRDNKSIITRKPSKSTEAMIIHSLLYLTYNMTYDSHIFVTILKFLYITLNSHCRGMYSTINTINCISNCEIYFILHILHFIMFLSCCNEARLLLSRSTPGKQFIITQHYVSQYSIII